MVCLQESKMDIVKRIQAERHRISNWLSADAAQAFFPHMLPKGGCSVVEVIGQLSSETAEKAFTKRGSYVCVAEKLVWRARSIPSRHATPTHFGRDLTMSSFTAPNPPTTSNFTISTQAVAKHT